jgi:hypothetical protein
MRWRVVQRRQDGKFVAEVEATTKRGNPFWCCIDNMKLHDTAEDARAEVFSYLQRLEDVSAPVVVMEGGK